MLFASASKWTSGTFATLKYLYSVNLGMVHSLISYAGPLGGTGKLAVAVSHIFLKWLFFCHSNEWMDSFFFFFFKKNTFAMIWWSSEMNKYARNNATVWSTPEYPLHAVLSNFQQLTSDVLPPVGVWNSFLIQSDTKNYNHLTCHWQFSHLHLLSHEVSSTVCYCTYFTQQQLFLHRSLCRKAL